MGCHFSMQCCPVTFLSWLIAHRQADASADQAARISMEFEAVKDAYDTLTDGRHRLAPWLPELPCSPRHFKSSKHTLRAPGSSTWNQQNAVAGIAEMGASHGLAQS